MKQTILDAVIKEMEAELERQLQANSQSNAGAAQSMVSGASQRDTTGYEASYLARGYAQHAQDLARQLEELKAMGIEDFSGQEIDVGAIVVVDFDGKSDCYMLLNCGGGTEVKVDGNPITVITPESPLGKQLMGNIEVGFVSLPSGLEGIILEVY